MSEYSRASCPVCGRRFTHESGCADTCSTLCDRRQDEIDVEEGKVVVCVDCGERTPKDEACDCGRCITCCIEEGKTVGRDCLLRMAGREA